MGGTLCDCGVLRWERYVSRRAVVGRFVGVPFLLQGPSLEEMSLAMSPPATPEAKNSLLKPRSLEQKARLNVGWLDSSLSIMEQGVREFDTLHLRSKEHGIP